MADDPDAPWRPGATVDMAESDRSWSFDPISESGDVPNTRDPSRWRRATIVAAVLASLGVVTAAVVLGADGSIDEAATGTTVPPSPVVLPALDRSLAEEERIARFADTGGDVLLAAGDAPISMGPATCLHSRLPASVPTRWSIELPRSSAVTGTIAVGADVGVASLVPTDGSFVGGVETVGFDLVSGDVLWRLDSSVVGLGGPQYVRVFDDVVVLVVRSGSEGTEPAMVAVASRSGDVVWEAQLGSREVVVGAVEPRRSIVTVAPDEDLSSARAMTSVFDAASGDLVRFRGAVVALDESSDLLLTREGDVLVAQGIDTTGLERLTVGVREDQVVALVGGQLLVLDEDARSMVRRSLEPRGPIVVDPLGLTGAVGIDPPDRVEELHQLDGSSVAIVSDTAVHGANVGERIVEIRWRVAGRLVDAAASDRGRTLLVERDDDDARRLIDSSTGRTILDLPLASVNPAAVSLHANGVVVGEQTGSSSATSAFDLDGRLLWTLPGVASLAVGDRTVIGWSQQVTNGETAVRIDAFGAVPDGPASCATASESVQGGPP